MEYIEPKEISAEDVDELFKLKRSDITRTLLQNYFAVMNGTTRARFQPNDTLMLNMTNHHFYNSTTMKTTVGRYIFNMFAIPVKYLEKYGYCNLVLDKKGIGVLENQLGKMIINNELETKEYAEFMDNGEWLTDVCAFFISPSLNVHAVLPIKEVIKRRDELFAQYKKEIAESNLDIAIKIEKELVALAKQTIDKSGNPSFDFFKQGAFSFDMNYKKDSIMIGAVVDPKDRSIQILKSNYADGLSKDEYDHSAKLSLEGGYSRGVATREYGYESKKYNSDFQNVEIDYDTEDCGTTKYLTITIPEKLKNLFLYRYIIENGKFVETTPENIDKYAGKTVKLRSPMFCKGDKLCKHCAGTLFQRIQMNRPGLIASNITGNLLNLSMKKFHDSSVITDKIDFEKYITEK